MELYTYLKDTFLTAIEYIHSEFAKFSTKLTGFICSLLSLQLVIKYVGTLYPTRKKSMPIIEESHSVWLIRKADTTITLKKTHICLLFGHQTLYHITGRGGGAGRKWDCPIRKEKDVSLIVLNLLRFDHLLFLFICLADRLLGDTSSCNN